MVGTRVQISSTTLCAPWCPQPCQLNNPPCATLGRSQGAGGTGAEWLRLPHLRLATLTMALSEGGAGLEPLITVTSEAARGVDTVTVGTEAGLGTAFVLI